MQTRHNILKVEQEGMCWVNVTVPQFHAELAVVAQSQANTRAQSVPFAECFECCGKAAYTEYLGWFGLQRDFRKSLVFL